MRNLNQIEKDILNQFLTKAFQGREVVAKQIENAKAEDSKDDDGYGSILLRTSIKEAAVVKERIPVEALVPDVDGIDIAILLHVVDGYINELEFFKVDGSPMIGKPDSQKMVVTIN